MRTVFYIFALRHRDNKDKFTFGPISRTWGEHAKAMQKYKTEGSSQYDRVYDFGVASISKTFGIRPPKHAPHTQHRPKSAGHQNKS